MKYVILHGSFGSPEGNWFPRLKEKLELLNQEVLVPKFPIDDWDEVTKAGEDEETKNQNLTNWLKIFENEVVPWVGSEKVVIVAHSLGPLFVLHALNKFDLLVDAAIFVSPFLHISRLEDAWQIDVANKTFYNHDFDFEELKKKIPLSFVLYSDGDPYVPANIATEFAEKLNSSLIPIMGGEHLSGEFNNNEFPLVLELCKSRIKLSLYQKYLAHISEHHPLDVIKKGKERALFLPSSELAKEGTFHFQNLNKSGFCTLPVKEVDFWTQKQSQYMSEGRKAAARVPVSRVYIFEKMADMENEVVKTSMGLDKKAGMKVSYCMRDDVNDISDEKLDFGIWDESYVCTVMHEGKKVMFALDSGEERMGEARKYMDMILGVSKSF